MFFWFSLHLGLTNVTDQSILSHQSPKEKQGCICVGVCLSLNKFILHQLLMQILYIFLLIMLSEKNTTICAEYLVKP